MKKPVRRAEYAGVCTITGKRKYPTRNSARKARASIPRKVGNPYRCKHCNYWHLGHLKQHGTRNGYRQPSPTGMIHLRTLSKDIRVSVKTLVRVCEYKNFDIILDHITTEEAEWIKTQTYRE